MFVHVLAECLGNGRVWVHRFAHTVAYYHHQLSPQSDFRWVRAQYDPVTVLARVETYLRPPPNSFNSVESRRDHRSKQCSRRRGVGINYLVPQPRVSPSVTNNNPTTIHCEKTRISCAPNFTTFTLLAAQNILFCRIISWCDIRKGVVVLFAYFAYLLLFLQIPCHLDPLKTSKSGPRLYNDSKQS